MLEGLGSFVQTALGVIAIVSLAGVGLQRTHTKNLRERLDDYEKEVAEKDRRDVERGAEISRLKAQVAAAETKIEALGEQVRGDAYWSSVGVKMDEASEKLEHHHLEARAHWRKDEEILNEIHDALRERP